MNLLETLQGPDGRLSSRKVTAFWFVALATADVLSILTYAYLLLFRAVRVDSNSLSILELLISLLTPLCLMVAVMFGIISGADVMRFVGAKRAKNPAPEVTVNKTEINNEAA